MSKRSPGTPGKDQKTHPPANHEELSLAALLDDEIVRLVMARDGVRPSDIRALTRIVPVVAQEGKSVPSA